MNKRTARARMNAALDGELTAEERAQLELHLAADPESEHLWATMRQVHQMLTVEPAQPAPPDFSARVMSQLATRKERTQPRVRRLFFLLVALGLVAAIVVPLLMGIGTVTLITREPTVLTSFVNAILTVGIFLWEVSNGLLTASSALLIWLLDQPALPASLAMGAGLFLVWMQVVQKLTPKAVTQ